MRTFRLTTRPAHNAGAVNLLRAQGFAFSPLPFYDGAFLLEEEPLPLGSSLAARFGCIYIQDASSMLPALALLDIARRDGAGQTPLRLLDLCSSPGGKSSLLGRELLENRLSFVLANERGGKRLVTLQRNLQAMNLFNCATSDCNGERLPLPDAEADGFAGWDYILLDPPCSGWGTAEKNPRVLTLWQGDKIKPLAALQKNLLAEAFRLLRPGGALVYSTCTTNVLENEEQTLWALDSLKDARGRRLRPLPLPPFPGFDFEEPLRGCGGVLRVAPDSKLGQGFFIAALRKDGPAPLRGAPVLTPCPLPDPLPGLTPDLLAGPLLDPALLPPGRLAAQGTNLYFQTQAALDFLPPNFPRTGFPLGKISPESARPAGRGRRPAPPAAAAFWSRPRPDSSLRGLMPTPEQAAARGAEVLNLEAIEPILDLIAGRSRPYAPADPNSQEAGLYFAGLPLCRLKIKGKRLMI